MDRDFREAERKASVNESDRLKSMTTDLRLGKLDLRVVQMMSRLGVREAKAISETEAKEKSSDLFFEEHSADLESAGRLLLRISRDDWSLSNKELWTLAAGLVAENGDYKTAEKLLFLRSSFQCDDCGESFDYPIQ